MPFAKGNKCGAGRRPKRIPPYTDKLHREHYEALDAIAMDVGVETDLRIKALSILLKHEAEYMYPKPPQEQHITAEGLPDFKRIVIGSTDTRSTVA